MPGMTTNPLTWVHTALRALKPVAVSVPPARPSRPVRRETLEELDALLVGVTRRLGQATVDYDAALDAYKRERTLSNQVALARCAGEWTAARLDNDLTWADYDRERIRVSQKAARERVAAHMPAHLRQVHASVTEGKTSGRKPSTKRGKK